MDWLLHLLGLCPDHMSHPNLITLFSSLFVGWFGLKYVYFRITRLYKPKTAKMWYKGDNDPSTDLGVDGDYYMDNVNGYIWHKTFGSWSLITNKKVGHK